MREIPFVVLVTLLAAIRCQSLKTDSRDLCGGCRILTPLIKDGKASEARSLSRVDSEKFADITSYSGFITVKEQYDSNLFFWFFPAETALETTPWIIWLQGGPGFSSMLGLFNIGPLKIEDGDVKFRNESFATSYSVLFLDNPVGAGFSFTNDDDGYPDNEDDVGAQMLEFLQQFLEMFPELRSAPFFLTGNSYAGKYIPALGIQIHRNNGIQNTNKNNTNAVRSAGKPHKINLKGLIIGGGMIDPRSMMHYSQLVYSLGILDDREIAHLKELEEATVRLVDEEKWVDASNKFNETIEYIKVRSDVNIYNFNQNPSRTFEAPDLEIFVNRKDIRKALGAGNATFDYDNQKVYEKMLPDVMNSTKPLIEELLEYYPILCYHGQNDIIMAYSLAMNLYRNLNWSKRQQYLDATRNYVLDAENNTVAYEKSGGNFAELLIRNVGHAFIQEDPVFATFIHSQFIEQHK